MKSLLNVLEAETFGQRCAPSRSVQARTRTWSVSTTQICSLRDIIPRQTSRPEFIDSDLSLHVRFQSNEPSLSMSTLLLPRAVLWMSATRSIHSKISACSESASSLFDNAFMRRFVNSAKTCQLSGRFNCVACWT